MGDEADDILRRLNLTEIQRCTYQEVRGGLRNFFVVKKNVIFERAIFNIQKGGEVWIRSSLHYMRWQSIVAMGLHNELIRDTIVVGLRDRGLSERIHLDLTLENAIRIARQSEEVKRQQSYLRGDTNSEAFTAATLSPAVERKEISSVLKMPEDSRHTVSSSRGEGGDTSRPRIVRRHEHLRGHGDGEPTAEHRLPRKAESSCGETVCVHA